jgi:signal recognition particle subunit SRP19
MPTVEDYFDDDTDLPLPSSSRQHLPNTGLSGALLEEIGDDFDFDKITEQNRGEYGANSKGAPPPSAKGKMVQREDPGDLRPSAPAGGMPGMPNIPGMNMNPNTPMGGFMGDMMKFQEAEEKRLAKLQKEFSGANVAADPAVYKS